MTVLDEMNKKFNEAILLLASGKNDEAEILYNELLDKMPDNHIILFHLFMVYFAQKDLDKAEFYLLKAILAGKEPRYYKDLGDIYYLRENPKEALNYYITALKSYPDDINILYPLALTYLLDSKDKNDKEYLSQILLPVAEITSEKKELSNEERAEILLNRALKLKPDFHQCYYHLASIYWQKRELQTAVNYLVKAIELKPKYAEALYMLGCIYLQTGNLYDGWKLFEARFYAKYGLPRPDLPVPLWDGSSLNGKTIYIYPEQGLGDTVMFSRYIPELNNLGARVLFKPEPELTQLFKDSSLPAEIINFKEPITEKFDCYLSIMSLPYMLKSDENRIPSIDKYLKADPEKVKLYKEKYFDNNDFKIGLVWQCKNLYKQDKFRSIPDLSYLYPLTRISGAKLYSFQKGTGEAQLANLPDDIDIVNLGSTFSNFSDTAAAIANIDLMITVDTSVPHLSGAMGKETLILLEQTADWKWLLDRDDSIWYEKVRLFRQNKPNDWKNVIDRVVMHIKTKNITK